MENKGKIMTITKTYCDRCGEEVIYPTTRKIYLSGIGREGGYDLCDSCHEELFMWFKRGAGVLNKIIAEIDDEAEYAYADFNEYKEDILHAEPDELPDDDFRYGLQRAVEIINKYKEIFH